MVGLRLSAPQQPVTNKLFAQSNTLITTMDKLSLLDLVQAISIIVYVAHDEYIGTVKNNETVENIENVGYIKTVENIQIVEYIETVRNIRTVEYIKTVENIKILDYIEAVELNCIFSSETNKIII